MAIRPERIDGIVAVACPCRPAIGGGIVKLIHCPERGVITLKVEDFYRGRLDRAEFDRLLVCGRNSSAIPIARCPLKTAVPTLCCWIMKFVLIARMKIEGVCLSNLKFVS